MMDLNKMGLVLLLGIIIIGFILLLLTLFGNRKSFYESFTGELAPFINFNLTQKPVANYAPYPIYLWWKYGHDRDRYRDCDQYRCQSPEGTYTSHDPGVTSRNWKIVGS